MADGVAITAGSGTTILTDDTGAGGHAQVVKLAIATDGSPTLIPADGTDGLLVNLGSNNDVAVTGTVTANLAAGTNNIGDVDVLSVPAPLSTTGGGTEAAALRVTLASDSTGVVSVDDNGGALTVDNGGTFAVQAAQSGTWTVQPGNTANTTAWLTTEIPNQYELAAGPTTHVKKYYTSAGAATDGIVWSPAAGKRWYVTDMIINVSAAATVTLEDDLTAGDSPVFKAELAANSGVAHSFKTPLYSGEDAADLLITTTAGNVYVTVTGYEI
jgi:hypothetical protein